MLGVAPSLTCLQLRPNIPANGYLLTTHWPNHIALPHRREARRRDGSSSFPPALTNVLCGPTILDQGPPLSNASARRSATIASSNKSVLVAWVSFTALALVS